MGTEAGKQFVGYDGLVCFLDNCQLLYSQAVSRSQALLWIRFSLLSENIYEYISAGQRSLELIVN